MESFLNRYRNITVLLLVIFAQLLLLAVQVKNDQDVHLIRVWTVTAVTPVARILESFRGGSIGFLRNYIMLHDADAENRRLQAQLDKLKVENIFLKNELNSADRAKALQLFQQHTPSRMLAASVILTGAGSNSKVVYVDRGSADGVMRGMAVVSPDGIVGKVIAAYPTASQVLLVTDLDFAAGVVSQKSQARGTFKGQGTPLGKVDYVPREEKIAEGDWFYTSGDDRVFPRGFPVGQVKAVHPPQSAQSFQEILVEPSGLQRGVEDVLIVMAGVHQEIPDAPAVNQPVYIGAPPPATTGVSGTTGSTGSTGSPASTGVSGVVALAPGGTEADKLRQQYKAIGEAQNHKFGEGEPGTKPPDFTRLGQNPQAATATATGPAGSAQRPTPANPVSPPKQGAETASPKPAPNPISPPKQPPDTASPRPNPANPISPAKQPTDTASPKQVPNPALPRQNPDTTPPKQAPDAPKKQPAAPSTNPPATPAPTKGVVHE
jgi:rod shape-determining protein MreC